MINLQRITVLTADVIASRSAQQAVGALSTAVTEIVHTDLVVPFTLSRGDEIQGVLRGWLTAPEIIRILRWRCRPLDLRIGIGLGTFIGELGNNPWALTGTAFFRAREALDRLNGQRRPGTTLVSGGPGEYDELVNAHMHLIDTIQGAWTDGQWQAVMSYEAVGTYAAAGRELGVAAQNVQKRCKAARWPEIRQAEQALGAAGRLLMTILG